MASDENGKEAAAGGRRGRGVWIMALLLIGAAVAVTLYLRNGAAPAGGERGGRAGRGGPVPVVAVAARKGNLDVYLNALGTVTPRNIVTVRARVDGQLMRVAFREGQAVKAGELLAEIDARPFEVQLAQANGQLARDQALLRNAEIDLDRYRGLLAKDSISRQQVDTQEALVRQYRGTVAVDQAQVDDAKLQLSYTRVTAPLSGRVGLRQVDPGNQIHASDPGGMVVITQLRPITVVFSIPEDSLPRVLQRMQESDRLEVNAYDRDQKKQLAAGFLVTVDNQIDPTTGTVKLKAQFPNDDGALFPNQFVNVRLKTEARQEALLIPASAVQRGKQGMLFVYVLKGDKTVTVRPIKVGPGEGELVIVDEGLAPGELVVAEGVDKLREGARVVPQSRAAGDVKGGGRPGGKRRPGGAPGGAPAR